MRRTLKCKHCHVGPRTIEVGFRHAGFGPRPTRGVPITIPAPERYALHKLIVASRRRLDSNGLAKRAKDVMQASSIMEALILTRKQTDLAIAFAEAHGKGPPWREALKIGFA